MQAFTVYVQDHSRPCILAIGGRKLPALLAKTYRAVDVNHAKALAQREIDYCKDDSPLVNAGIIWTVRPGPAQSSAVIHGIT